MAFRLEDFKCTDCGHVTEVLFNTTEEQEIICEECGSKNLQKILSIGSGKGGHVSWSKWRAQQ